MMDNNKIDEKVFEITLLEQQIKKLKDLVDKNKEEIKEEIIARDVETIDTGACKVSYLTVVKNNFDTKKAKEFIGQNANLDDFIVPKPENRFTVTVITTR